ncbi:MAG: molybdenum cofactor biosynthesis protein MoaE [Acidimicrobiales bacterium]
MGPAGATDDWVAIMGAPLPVADALAWVTTPGYGAQVLFTGTVRDHAEGRPGVQALTYEAYEGPATDRLAQIATSARARWDIGRVALLHRVGRLRLTEVAVVVAVGAAHREPAFAAARWCIDEAKATAPIWKREHFEGGDGWATGAQPLRAVGEPH